MITLRVKRNRKGQLVLIDKKPIGVKLVFHVNKPRSEVQKQITKMWSEFNEKTDYVESDKRQINIIKKLALKYFNIVLTWDFAGEEACGWPTDNYWRANKLYITKKIKYIMETRKGA